MSAETKSNYAKSRKQRPRLLVVNNPSPDDGSSDEERMEIGVSHNYTSTTSTSTSTSTYPRPLPSPSQAISRGERPQTSSSSHIPTPLTTNLPEHRPFYPSSRSNPSNPALSSPSSTSSPAIESTPPPSTPGQTAPSDLTSDGTQDTVTLPTADRNDNTLPSASRSTKFLEKFKSHLPRSGHVRRSSNNCRAPSSPTTTTPDSYAPPSNHVLRSNTTERVILFVTADAENFITVDITGAMTPAFIRERIFTKLQIPDEEQARFSIYRTEIGTYAIGDALTDEELFDLYRHQGDSKATLKLFVSHSSAPVHEPSHDPGLTSPTGYTLPPPVLPQHTLFAPLQPIRRSRSRHDSQSSAASERLPTETAAGYDASVSDDLEHEMRRSTIRPLPQARIPAPPHRPASPAAAYFPQSLPTALALDRPPPHTSESNIVRPDVYTSTAVSTTLRHPLSPQYSKIHDRPHPIPPSQRDSSAGQSGDNRFERDNVPEGPEAPASFHEKPRRSAPERDERERERQERERPRRQGIRRQAGFHHSIHDSPEARTPEDWTVIPSSDIPSSEYRSRKGRPTTPQETRSPSSRYQGTGFGSFGVHSPPRASPSSGPGESRSKRNMKQVPANWAISWKGPVNPGKAEQKPMQSPPAQPWPRMLGAKSMNDLRGAFKHPPSLQPGRPKHSQPQLPLVSRPSTGGSAASTGSEFTSSVSSTSETMSSASQEQIYADIATPRSYEPQRPVMSPAAYPSSRPAVSPGYSSNQSSGLGHLGITSPQEPYARPRSAVDDVAPYRPARVVQSPPRGTDLPSDNVSARSPRPLYNGSPQHSVSALSPASLLREDAILASSSRPSPFSRIEPQSDTPLVGSEPLLNYSRHPRTPPHNMAGLPGAQLDSVIHDMNVPPSPAVNTKSCADRLTIEEDDGVEVTTLRPEDHPWSGFIDENAAEGTGTARPRRQVSARPVPTPNIPTTYGSPGSSNWTGTTLVEPGRPDDDSDSDEGTIWAKAPKRAGESVEESFKNYISPEKTRTTRPPLPPLSIEGSSAPNATILPSSVVFPDPKAPPADFPGPPAFIPPAPPPLRPTRRPSTKSGGSRQRQDQRTSRFDDNFDYTWAPRPPPEDVYERLEEYFPEHDLDRPVIETPSGGTSPTATESPTPHRFRHKKSIRVVAAEHKRRIDRTSHADASSVSVALRKRNTKLWGSKLEEVTAGQPNTGALSVTDPSPGGALKPIFRWVRGELIGKGTYGKVYLALNATTGEMIAVKQVEIPRTASDKSDTRQVSVVEALKLESETLKDLDHPNIVQYLGFEETPTFLSIFLEYVPGGSIGSCLRKHGKFDEEVTKSFTEQILAGLEYLHSRGILHRDMKADNILVETSGICKISDFGISKRTEDIEMAGAYTSMQGTVFWMAPEVINSSKQGYNSKIDIWSVGCVVFEMWTGQRPWNGQEAMAVLLHLYQTKEGPSLPADVVLSPLADDFRQKCFAMDPDERPSAAELRRHPYLELQPGWQFNGFK